MFNDHQFLQMKSTQIRQHNWSRVLKLQWATVQNSDPFRFLVLTLNTSFKKKIQRFDFIYRINRNSNKMSVAARVSNFFSKSSLEESLNRMDQHLTAPLMPNSCNEAQAHSPPSYRPSLPPSHLQKKSKQASIHNQHLNYLYIASQQLNTVWLFTYRMVYCTYKPSKQVECKTI